MAILRGIYPRYICDFEAEKTSLIAGNPNGTMVTVRANGGKDYVLTDGVWVSTGKVIKNYTSSETESLNSTTSFVTKLSTVFNVTESVEFQLSWSYEQSNSAADKTQETQIRVDGVEINLDTVRVAATGLYMNSSNFVNKILTFGSHTVDIRFRQVSGGTMKIRRTRLDISKT